MKGVNKFSFKLSIQRVNVYHLDYLVRVTETQCCIGALWYLPVGFAPKAQSKEDLFTVLTIAMLLARYNFGISAANYVSPSSPRPSVSVTPAFDEKRSLGTYRTRRMNGSASS